MEIVQFDKTYKTKMHIPLLGQLLLLYTIHSISHYYLNKDRNFQLVNMQMFSDRLRSVQLNLHC